MNKNETRWCDRGCGYKLLPEYAPHETTCGACLDTDFYLHDENEWCDTHSDTTD